MSRFTLAVVLAATLASVAGAQGVPDNLVAEGVPPIPPELRRQVTPYLESRTAAFQSWHPVRRELLITTRFADTMQLHHVRQPRGAREQLTFLPEPVAGASFRPKTGDYILFTQDTGGGEFFQFYRFDLGEGVITLLTDGKARNTGARWADSGNWIAYASTRRNGRDNDLYLMNPADPKTDRRIAELAGGGWSVADWSPDEATLLVANYVSINESHLHLLDVKSGQLTALTPPDEKGVAYGDAQFSHDGKAVFFTTDKGAEFQGLARMELTSRAITPLTPQLKWDVTAFELSPDGQTIAYVANEDGVSGLHFLDLATGREKPAPRLPLGVIGGIEWHPNGRDLGFSMTDANSPSDAYSVDVTTGELTRWTFSETGGLNAARFRRPELARMKSFDGLEISALVYRPDPAKFPGRRPVIVNIHGGPEGQSRPIFQGRNNYLLDELGIAIVYPNVRGSSGYGKTFLTLDNGFKREDSVKDIGAVLDWIKQQPDLDAGRIGVTGGSYGGYMTLAVLTHYSDRVKSGVDVVGISNFVTFLENTQDYRRDLRRVEYGDERDPAMRAHLEKISPMTNVKDIGVPLFVVQGKNDPRVPVTEAEQMVKALRDHGGTVWYLMAKDEGHGFAKKRNADYQFLATIQFWRDFLLK